MINDKQMQYVKSENGFDYFIFTPTIIRQYYNKTEDWTQHRRSITHKLHMFLYYIRGGYWILYMMDSNNIVSYAIYARCGKTVIKDSTRDDIFTVYVTTHPDYRKRGLATKLIYTLLHSIGVSYRSSYKTIYDSNIGSKKAAFANGYTELFQVKKSKVLKTISRTNSGDLRLYIRNSHN